VVAGRWNLEFGAWDLGIGILPFVLGPLSFVFTQSLPFFALYLLTSVEEVAILRRVEERKKGVCNEIFKIHSGLTRFARYGLFHHRVQVNFHASSNRRPFNLQRAFTGRHSATGQYFDSGVGE